MLLIEDVVRKPFFSLLIQRNFGTAPGTAVGLFGTWDVTWQVWQRRRGPGMGGGWRQRGREAVYLSAGRQAGFVCRSPCAQRGAACATGGSCSECRRAGHQHRHCRGAPSALRGLIGCAQGQNQPANPFNSGLRLREMELIQSKCCENQLKSLV